MWGRIASAGIAAAALAIAGCSAGDGGGAVEATGTAAGARAERATTAGVSPLRMPGDCTWAEVKRVIDGDTVAVVLDGREERVRYVGIDTAERDEDGELRGIALEATERNEELVPVGSQVCLEAGTIDRDFFGRLLRYPWNEDGVLVTVELVREGLAELYDCRGGSCEVSRYREMEEEAWFESRGAAR